jgi:protein archease
LIQDVQAGYRTLDHVTDALIEAWAPTFEEALVQAALGLFDTMVDARNVKPDLEEDLLVEGHDELELVYNWLEQLLLSFEIKQEVLAHFHISSIKKTDGSILLTAKVQGEKYDPTAHRAKVEVKGVTYHLMEIRREPSKVRITYLLDL